MLCICLLQARPFNFFVWFCMHACMRPFHFPPCSQSAAPLLFVFWHQARVQLMLARRRRERARASLLAARIRWNDVSLSVGRGRSTNDSKRCRSPYFIFPLRFVRLFVNAHFSGKYVSYSTARRLLRQLHVTNYSKTQFYVIPSPADWFCHPNSVMSDATKAARV